MLADNPYTAMTWQGLPATTKVTGFKRGDEGPMDDGDENKTHLEQLGLLGRGVGDVDDELTKRSNPCWLAADLPSLYT